MVEKRGAESKEDNVHDERHEDAGLLGIVLNEQNPPRQRQLAAHLEWLSPEGCSLVVTREEVRRATQRRFVASAERVTAGPQQHHVEQGDPHWPQGDKEEGNDTGTLVALCVARQPQVSLKVTTHLAFAVIERVARKVRKTRVETLGTTSNVHPRVRGRMHCSPAESAAHTLRDAPSTVREQCCSSSQMIDAAANNPTRAMGPREPSHSRVR
eukprot:999936-Prymnesium_polylepis.1